MYRPLKYYSDEFTQKSIISIEKGLDVLPLLKRALEERNGFLGKFIHFLEI